MSNPACILVYGRDHGLLETRCLVLESTGGAVHATTRLDEAQRILRDERPDLLVLCYTLSAEDRASIQGLAERLLPGIKTMILNADGAPTSAESDYDVFAGARAFKARVIEILSQPQTSAEERAN